jgi:hypothetical protein
MGVKGEDTSDARVSPQRLASTRPFQAKHFSQTSAYLLMSPAAALGSSPRTASASRSYHCLRGGVGGRMGTGKGEPGALPAAEATTAGKGEPAGVVDGRCGVDAAARGEGEPGEAGGARGSDGGWKARRRRLAAF